jgi:hypothetical protein
MAKHEFRTLDKLPPELIVQIASSTTPETILALAQVSRSLRQTCYDSLVFLEAFDDRKWAKQWLGDHTANIDLIARYAVAESRYLQFLGNEQSWVNLEAKVIPTTSELLRYLPNLSVLCNSAPDIDTRFLRGRRLMFKEGIVDDIRMAIELENLGDKQPIVSMLYACGLLAGAPTTPSSSNLDDELLDHNHITFYTYENLAIGIRNQSANYTTRFHYDCLIGLGKTATLLACAYPSPEKNPSLPENYLTAGLRHATHVDIPLISKIPLAKTPLSIPLPFLPANEALNSWRHWMHDQRCIQSIPSYLDSGEWVGMYTYNEPFPLGVIATSFDAPMIGIRFKTQGPLTSAGGFLSYASGSDGVGEFDLTLSMDTDGYIRGRKTYKQQPTAWSWFLTNSPLGLYGLWASERHGIRNIGMLGGAVWLWKREWCE